MVWRWALPVALTATLWLLLGRYSEHIVAVFERRGTGAARRRAFPPGTHSHPTPVLGPPDGEVAKLEWSSDLHALPDGRRIWWQRIAPRARAPRAVVVFIHGFADHSDFALYNTARAFVQRTGCAALLVDMPGHGRSDGLHALVPHWPRHLEALGHWCDAVCVAERARWIDLGAKLPLFAFGASLGGAVAIGLALRRPEDFDGLMLVAPMVGVAPHVRLYPGVEQALQLLGHIPILQELPLFKGRELAALNYAQEAIWRLEEDRRLNRLHYWGSIRPQTARSITWAADAIERQMGLLRTPLLVLHGAADQTVPPELSAELVRRANATDKTLELVTGGTHGLHYGESVATMRQVYDIMFTWLDRRMSLPLPESAASS